MHPAEGAYMKRQTSTTNASVGGVISQLKRDGERYRKALEAVQKFLHMDKLPVKEQVYLDVVTVVDRALGVRGEDGVRISNTGRELRPAEIRSRKR